jgi:hypothetical protein
MKTAIKILALLAAFFSITACEQEEDDIMVPHTIEYTVSRHDIPNISTTVVVRTHKDYDSLLDSLCDYTLQGKFVVLHGNKKSSHSTKEPTTYSTTDREAMKQWMARMEDAGLTVTVTYDSRTHTWNGMAYVNTTDGTSSQQRRLSRVTMDYEPYPDVYAEHYVYTYFWNGDRLTDVDMVKERFNRFMLNGVMVDSIFYTHHTVTLTYSDSLRSAAYFLDADGTMLKNIQYTYQDGRLFQEQQNGNTYTYHYNSEGLIDHLTATPGYDLAMPVGVYYEWADGDLIRAGIDNYEYDNSPHPYGVSFGTSTLMPGYSQPSTTGPTSYEGYILQETQWSRHNLTHYRESSKSHLTEYSIHYTYDSQGYPVTAECVREDKTIRWTYEYND